MVLVLTYLLYVDWHTSTTSAAIDCAMQPFDTAFGAIEVRLFNGSTALLPPARIAHILLY